VCKNEEKRWVTGLSEFFNLRQSASMLYIFGSAGGGGQQGGTLGV